MIHDVSASAIRSSRMAPSAPILAVLLHVAVALALWWMAGHPPALPAAEEPIEVTIEQPKPRPPTPAPKPELPKKEQATPPPKLGLAPPAEITADKPSHVSSTAKETQQAMAPAPPAAAFEPPKPTKPPLAPQTRSATALPAARPTPPAPQPQFRPSPLTRSQRPQAPSMASREAPSLSPFVNPADAYNRARVADNYLWQVAARLQGYHYYARVNVEEGTTVVRIVIARDGRLLAASVAQSSGEPALDNGVLAGVRAGAPYAPLPDSIPGNSATFNLPLVSVNGR